MKKVWRQRQPYWTVLGSVFLMQSICVIYSTFSIKRKDMHFVPMKSTVTRTHTHTEQQKVTWNRNHDLFPIKHRLIIQSISISMQLSHFQMQFKYEIIHILFTSAFQLKFSQLFMIQVLCKELRANLKWCNIH